MVVRAGVVLYVYAYVYAHVYAHVYTHISTVYAHVFVLTHMSPTCINTGMDGEANRWTRWVTCDTTFHSFAF